VLISRAVYSVTFDRATVVATVKPVFYDEAPATVANVISRVLPMGQGGTTGGGGH
jgi:hypothetical protein